MPKEDARKLLKNRYPFPKTIETDADGGDARYLKAKVNPSLTHHSTQQNGTSGAGIFAAGSGSDQGAVVLTDDASLQDFMNGLKKLAVE